MKKLLLLFIILSFNLTYSQTLKPNVTVDPHTGRGTISIPMGVMSTSNLSLPVNLIYDGGGMQMNNDGKSYDYERIDNTNAVKFRQIGRANSLVIASNWTLQVGGSIRREVKGIPDELTEDRGIWGIAGNYGIEGLSYINSINSHGIEKNNILNFQNYGVIGASGMDNIDTELDVFSFDVGDLHGRFILRLNEEGGTDYNGRRLVHTLPFRDDLKISYTSKDGLIDEFEIETNSGIKYKFQTSSTVTEQILPLLQDDDVDTTYLYHSKRKFKKPLKYVEEWGLISVTTDEDPIGIQVLYNHESREESIIPKEFFAKELATGTYKEKNLYLDKLERVYKTPRSINCAGSSISFTKDIVSVSIPGYRKNFSFYTELKGIVHNPLDKQRSFLREIVESQGCIYLPSLKFSYHAMDIIPPVASVEQDAWGFFNASKEANDRLYPRIYIYPNRNNADRYRLTKIPSDNNYFELTGANRDANGGAVTVGALNKITMPYGGQTFIEYESNEYFDKTAGINIKGGGIRVKKITISDGVTKENDITKIYTYEPNGGRVMQTPSFVMPVTYASHYLDFSSEFEEWDRLIFRSPQDMGKGDNGVYYIGSSEKILGKGTTKFSFSDPIVENNLTKSFNSYSESLFHSTINGNTNVFPYPLNTDFDFENPSLLSTKYYDANGVLSNEKTYTYEIINNNTSVNSLLGIDLESESFGPGAGIDDFVYGIYSWFLGAKVLKSEENIIYNGTAQLKSTTEYFRESTNHKSITRIKTINSNGDIYQSYIKYALDYDIPYGISSYEVSALKWLIRQGINSQIESTQTITPTGGNEKVIGAKLTLYKDVRDNNNRIKFCFPEKQFNLAIASPITNFIPLSVNLINGSHTFDERYKLSSTNTTWKYGRSIESVNKNKEIHSTVMMNSVYKKADVLNARLGEIAFNDFAGTLNAGGTLSKQNITKNSLTDQYVFSCWINSASSGTLTLTLNDSNSHTVTKTVNYTNTNGEYKFFKCFIPVNVLDQVFNFSVQASSSITANDETAFYPRNASLKYYTYNSIGQIASEKDGNGKALYYEYEDLSRLSNIKNENLDILKRITYPIIPKPYNLNSIFTYSGENYDYQGLQFNSQYQEGCIVGATYLWSFGDGTTSNLQNPKHRYIAYGKYVVTLTVSHPDYNTSTTSIEVNVFREFRIEMCTSGPTDYNVITHTPFYPEESCDIPHEPAGSNTFYIGYDAELDVTAVISYNWEIKYAGGSWANLPSTTEICEVNVLPLPSSSYTVRGTMTISNSNYLDSTDPTFITSKSLSAEIRVVFTDISEL